METENPKLFIHGIFSTGITENTLKQHFSDYGEVIDVIVMPHKGIGYVTFSDPSMARDALQRDHIILHHQVGVKLAKPRVKKVKTKIFVGGLPHAITKEEFTQYFEEFGTITDSVVIHNKETGKSRGFGFITFESEEAAKRVLQNNFHDLKGKRVEVKWATPRLPACSESTISSDTSITNPTTNGTRVYSVYSQPYFDFSPSPYLENYHYTPSHEFYGNRYYYQPWARVHSLPCYYPYSQGF